MNIKNFLLRKGNELIAFKELAELYDFAVKFEQKNNKAVYRRIYKKGKVIISLSAIVWNKNFWQKHRTYKAEIIISDKELKNISTGYIRDTLMKDIFNQIIKNEIIMI